MLARPKLLRAPDALTPINNTCLSVTNFLLYLNRPAI